MYTIKNITDCLSKNYISSMMRNKLIFCLDEDKNTSRQMTDFLIFLIHVNEQMMNNYSEMMKKYNDFFIQTSEQLEYSTYLSRNQIKKVKEKLQELKLIECDNKSHCQKTQFKVNYEEIVNLLNEKEHLFRERESEFNRIFEEKKQKEENRKKEKEEFFKEVNKLKYDNFNVLRDFMIQNNYTLIDSIIVSVVSKMYLKHKLVDFVFREVDLNTIRSLFVNDMTRKEEFDLMMNHEDKYNTLLRVLDVNRLIRACKSTSSEYYRIRDIYESLSIVDRYKSEYRTTDKDRNYTFENDEECDFIMRKLSSSEIQFYLEQN